jgi:predicted phage baseplate assembly protein
LNNQKLDGIFVTVRNPLAAVGGTNAEPLNEAKLFAPYLFRKEIQRAITAADYQQIAERNDSLQRANAALVWTGSWYEADIAVDPLGREQVTGSFRHMLEYYLEKFRRIGHDLAVTQARYVPLRLTLNVCALPHYQQAHIRAALLAAFSNRVLAGGKLGFFHPDNLTFGEGIYLSRIIAAGQAVDGVECIRVTEFRRLFDVSNHEIENGVLPLQAWEIAQLDNDPNYPEHGQLEIHLSGGR